MVEANAPADFEQVDRVLKTLDCDIGASECHGVLCGMLCSARNFQIDGWLEHTLGYSGDDELHELAASPVMSALFKETLSSIDSEEFSFDLLLPEDKLPLTIRIEALGAWCRGFLSGFGLSDMQQIKDLSEETQDYLRDLGEIGKVDPKALEEEGNEHALFEVQEYTRVGALLLREEFKNSNTESAQNSSASKSPSVH